MGTRADFYVGKGKDAEWLGSIAWDGYPSGLKEYEEVLTAKSEDTFRTSVGRMIDSRDDGTTPDMGWPWPWETSDTTDYAYLFIDGAVWASSFGSLLFDPEAGDNDGPDEDDESGEKIEFPDMSDRAKPTLGKRSGVIVITPDGLMSEGWVD